MKMERIMIQLPKTLKRKLNALRNKGYTASGFIRATLEKEFSTHLNPKKKERERCAKPTNEG